MIRDHGEKFDFKGIHPPDHRAHRVRAWHGYPHCILLRISAHSLAHQQISLVFFQKTMSMRLEMSFPVHEGGGPKLIDLVQELCPKM